MIGGVEIRANRGGTRLLRAEVAAVHGTEIAPSVRKRLQELYPEDRATGFRADDFRGLFWVKLKLRESA